MADRGAAFRRTEGSRPNLVSFTVDGIETRAPEGEPLAAALAVGAHLQLRKSPRAGTPRGAFCFMGVCQECVVEVDGMKRQACITPVAAGMRVVLGGAS